MASVLYLNNGVFRATWKTNELTIAGKPKYINRRFRILDPDGNRITNPTKAQIQTRAKEIQAIVDKLERGETDQSKPKSQTTTHPLDLPVQHHVRAMMRGNPTTSSDKSTIRARMVMLEDFVRWLDLNDTISLRDFNRKHVLDYVSYMSLTLAQSTIKTRVRGIAATWTKFARYFDHRVDNPWASAGRELSSIIRELDSVNTGAFSVDWISGFAQWLDGERRKMVEGASINSPGANVFADELYVFFLLLLTTGWRREDVRTLTWESVDLEKRVIKVTHGKTRKQTGVTTYLWLTDLMVEALQSLRPHQTPQASLFHFSGGLPSNVLIKYIDTVDTPMDFKTVKLGSIVKRSHTLHSMRKSVITHLKTRGISSDIVEYIVGHAGRGVEAQYYDRWIVDVRGATEKAMQTMCDIWSGAVQERESREREIRDLIKRLDGVPIEKIRELILSLTNGKTVE